MVVFSCFQTFVNFGFNLGSSLSRSRGRGVGSPSAELLTAESEVLLGLPRPAAIPAHLVGLSSYFDPPGAILREWESEVDVRKLKYKTND